MVNETENACKKTGQSCISMSNDGKILHVHKGAMLAEYSQVDLNNNIVHEV